MNDLKIKIENSIKRVEKWVEDHYYKGYEPFDGLSSFLKPLTFHNTFAERILQQTIRQSPINLRPLVGIKPHVSANSRAYMAWGYLKMFQQTNSELYRIKAIDCLDWLIDNKSSNYSDFCWGYPFAYSGRSVKHCKNEPTIVWTSLAGQVFLDAYEILGDQKYIDVANSICEWILALPREHSGSGLCLSYVIYDQVSIHNSNMLGAAVLARTAILTNNNKTLKAAKSAVEYSCSKQHSNGAWYYGEELKNHWIDNFHTGYNLDSLKCYIDYTKDTSFNENLNLGFKYFSSTFFEKSGRPKYYHNRTYPVDIQCASQAIDTLSYFSEYDESALELAYKVAAWTIDNMQDKNGFFFYRELLFYKVKIPMLHWGQATMYKALTHLLLKSSKIAKEVPQ